MRIEIDSGGLRLAGHLYQPTNRRRRRRTRTWGLVLCHGFPAGPGGSATSGQQFRRVRRAAGRRHRLDRPHLQLPGRRRVRGRLLPLRLAHRPAGRHRLPAGDGPGHGRVAGRVGHRRGHRHLRRGRGRPGAGRGRLAPHADFRDWGADPDGFLEHARPSAWSVTPPSPPTWTCGPGSCSRSVPSVAIGKLPPRPVLLVHGVKTKIVHLPGRPLAGRRHRRQGRAAHRPEPATACVTTPGRSPSSSAGWSVSRPT